MKNSFLLLSIIFLTLVANLQSQEKGSFIDPRDSTVYVTIKIGNQVWMAENLHATRYRNGDPVTNVKENAKWSSLTKGAYCDYKNSVANSKTYGRLYNFYAVSDPRGIAPEGWHVPTIAEWTAMLEKLGGAVESGGKLKEAGTVHWLTPNTGAINSTGFSALPGGCCFGGMEQFYDIGKTGYFWSSTSDNVNDAQHEIMYNNNNGVSKYSGKKTNGFSLRCIKD
jgi:uncharacterized protein (TIGR02145 family)